MKTFCPFFRLAFSTSACHVARAAHHGAQHIGRPDDDGAAEQHVGIRQCRVERRAAPAHSRVHAAAEAEQHDRECGSQHAGDEQRLLRQAASFFIPPRAQRACDGGGDGTADTAARHLHHQHRQRKDQCDAGKRVGAQPAKDVAVVADDDRHREQADDIGGGQAQQRRQQRPVQHLLRA